MAIEILSPQLANQIAAGEVVERPSSVVKELVENSLDAGADQVEIQILQGGAGLILIRDNGSGISKADLPFALARHATSKIKDMDDLISILSFGFRGEALASISSVSRLTLTSRTAEQSEAWQVYAEGREMNAVIKPAAHPVGTTVEVRNLFYNTPARRKFLRTDKTEFNHIDEVIRRIALVRHDVTFILTHNDKRVRYYKALTAKADLDQKRDRIAAICGQKFIESAKHIQWEHFDLAIEGWILPLNVADKDTHQTQGVQYCYVNGRIVRDKVIMHAIKQAFQTYYPDISASDDKLAYVIYLNVKPEEVDVNVHPAKHEVRFHQTRLVHDFVFQAVIESLKASQHNGDLFQPGNSPLNQPVQIIDNNRQAAGLNQFAKVNTTLEQATPDPLYETPIAQKAGSDETDNSMTEVAQVVNDENASGRQQSEFSDETISANESKAEIYQTLFPKRSEAFDKQAYQQLIQNKPTHYSSNAPTSKQANAKQMSLYQTLMSHPQSDNHSNHDSVQSPHVAKVVASHHQQTSLPVEYAIAANTFGKALHVMNGSHLLLVRQSQEGHDELIMICLKDAAKRLRYLQLKHVIVDKSSQALLVPISVRLKANEWQVAIDNEVLWQQLQIQVKLHAKQKIIEIYSVPAPLRHGDIAVYVATLLAKWEEERLISDKLEMSIDVLAGLLVAENIHMHEVRWSLAEAITLIGDIERLSHLNGLTDDINLVRVIDY